MLVSYLLCVLTLATGALSKSPVYTPVAPPPGFATARNGQFIVNSGMYSFAGGQQYWLTSRATTDDVWRKTFDRYKELGVRVARVFVYGIDSTAGPSPAVYHQWSGAKLTVNYGENGLGRIDKMLAMAKQYNMKVILVLADNWGAQSGSMNTYVRNVIGAAGNYHSDFFTNAAVIKVYEQFVQAVVTRYKASPEVFAWELANEQQGDITSIDGRRARPGFTAAAMTKWIADRSAFIKRLDPHHMVSIGDMGYYNIPGHSKHTHDGKVQMDFEANLRIPTIDFGTFHLYEWFPPTKEWGLEWIKGHVDSMKKIGKPVICEEFGAAGGNNQTAIYPAWVKAMLDGGLNGVIPWQVSGVGIYKQASQKTFDDLDIYPEKTVVWSTLKNMAQVLNARRFVPR
ncbi:hypothetical protein Q8F55_009287 [Vanrija albida]|uniref:mannan endo-1,4-beta-mannosidase n=1 Tax=Vanrija albida TaxID=181172 RepID=A0ABR3PU69_9TREE